MWSLLINPLSKEGGITLKLIYIIFRIFYPLTMFFGIIGAIWLILLGLWWVVLICVGIIFISSLFLQIFLESVFNEFHKYYIESIDKGKFPFIRPFIRIFLFNFFIIQAVYGIFDIIFRPYLINSYPLLPLLLIAYFTSTMPFYISLKSNLKEIIVSEHFLKDLTSLSKISSHDLRIIGLIENKLDNSLITVYFLTRIFRIVQGYILFLSMFFILKRAEELSSLFSLIYTIIFIIVPYFQLKGLINAIKMIWKCSNCGYINDIGTKFCSRCGKDLNDPFTSSS
jgi:hypothetical protein